MPNPSSSLSASSSAVQQTAGVLELPLSAITGSVKVSSPAKTPSGAPPKQSKTKHGAKAKNTSHAATSVGFDPQQPSTSATHSTNYLPPIGSIAQGTMAFQQTGEAELANLNFSHDGEIFWTGDNGLMGDNGHATFFAPQASTSVSFTFNQAHSEAGPSSDYGPQRNMTAYPQNGQYTGQQGSYATQSNGMYAGAQQPQMAASSASLSAPPLQQNVMAWRPMPGGGYPGGNLPNQLTSSTPDSGIQSIDGSPPSTSAFTPPMISPYQMPPTSAGGGGGGGGGGGVHLDAMSAPLHQSHIQLPPLLTNNRPCTVAPSLPTTTTVPVPTSTYTQVSPTHNACFTSDDHRNERASGSVAPSEPRSMPPNETTTDDSHTDTATSVSSTSLHDGGGRDEEDSDVDYSDMPTLIRVDHSKAATTTCDADEEVEGPGPVTEDATSRTSSRISEIPEEPKAKSSANDSTEGFAITADMSPDEIAFLLKSSLPEDKVKELLRHILPEHKAASSDGGATTSADDRKKGRARRRSNPAPQPSPDAADTASPSPPPRTSTRVNGKSATRNASAKRKKSGAISKKKTAAVTTTSVVRKRARCASPPVELPPAPETIAPSASASTDSAFIQPSRIRVLARPAPRAFCRKFTTIRARSRGERTGHGAGLLSTLDGLSGALRAAMASKYPSTLLAKRYAPEVDEMAATLERCHLRIPKVPMLKGDLWGRFTPKKSSGEPPEKRKRKSVGSGDTVAKKKSKTTVNGKKLGPLKVHIPSTPAKAPPVKSAAVVPKKKTSLTPINREDYFKIRSNALIEAPPRMSIATKVCDCTESEPCSSNSCSSRSAFIECTQYSCQLYTTCRNRRLQNNESVHQLQLFKRPPLNNGVRSTVDIQAGQLICEFVGEVMRRDTYLKRLEGGESYPGYAIEIVPGSYVVDASRKGNLSRFMNHSCQPNCVLQRWDVNGVQRIGIIALTAVDAGVELTYDYGLHVFREDVIDCACGCDNCRGTVPCLVPAGRQPLTPPVLTRREQELISKTHIFLKRTRNAYLPDRPLPKLHLPSGFPGSQKRVSECLVEIGNDLTQHIAEKKIMNRRLVIFTIRMVQQMFYTVSASTSTECLLETFDSTVRHCLSIASRSVERRQVDSLHSHFLHLKRQSRLVEIMSPEDRAGLLAFFAERPRGSHRRSANHSPRIISATADLSYMDSDHPVGSYDPDAESNFFTATATQSSDSVRCVCGIMDDGGFMYQCDDCKFWLHRECLGMTGNGPAEFICPFCEKGLKSTPALDILLVPQPDYRIDGCVYYKTLVNCRNIQVRVNECVYVEKVINDEYKKLLKQFHEECVADKRAASKNRSKSRKKQSSPSDLPPNLSEPPPEMLNPDAKRIYDRKDLRAFRIERLFTVPSGQRFAFGCYYARPHETFVDPGRMFYRNELFWTPLFDTLPVDAIVGRCLCLEPHDYARGRPKGPKYHDEDIFICEYAIDRTQKQFERISGKNRYQINTAHYLFDRFDKPLRLKRNFTPFVVNSGKSAGEKSSKAKVSAVVRQTLAEHLEAVVERIHGNGPA